jgi:hypothetical protein
MHTFLNRIVTVLLTLLFTTSLFASENKELIRPYFDENYYKSQYGDRFSTDEIDPLEHFLSVNYNGEWFTFTDPNAWFNSTLYLRTFKCWGNPFIDFLSQPDLSLPSYAPVMDVYACPQEAVRAWLAVEALMRLNEYRVVLHLSPNFSREQLKMFKPQEKRGLVILGDNEAQVSFYQSPFLENPVDHASYPSYAWNQALSLWDNDPRLLVHRAYYYNSWFPHSLINPLRLNFFHYVDEPNFSVGAHSLEAYVRKISDGFDLMFCPVQCAKNVQIIPGYMQTEFDTNELNDEKEFSVSFLLSTGYQGYSPTSNYSPRIYIWHQQDVLGIPTRFYVTKRGIHQFPAEMQSRALPTDSKKWILNSQFSIAIENNRQTNYLTEKLLGCFVSMTVPIYLGCPNVRDYFDERGMFIAESPEEVIKICQNITPRTYDRMLPYLIENRKRALDLMGLQRRLMNEFLMTHSLPLDNPAHRLDQGG